MMQNNTTPRVRTPRVPCYYVVANFTRMSVTPGSGNVGDWTAGGVGSGAGGEMTCMERQMRPKARPFKS